MSNFNQWGVQVWTFSQETAVSPYRIVKLGTAANEVVHATGATAPLIWISNESASATADDEVGVITNWMAKLTILAATTKWAYITATTAWKWAATTTDTNEYVGILMETTTVANQVATVKICPWRYAG